MNVVFLKNVPNVAKAGDIKNVPDGYARNYLIPNKLATPATANVKAQLEAQAKAQEKKHAQMEAEHRQTAEQIQKLNLVIKAKTGSKNRLFGSITSADIAKELENSAGLVVDKRKIELPEPIRELGVFDVIVKLYKDINAKLKVTVKSLEEN
ncbi:MAG: 50S ribosomal protein L9 [Dehalococcoidales bacterium]|jgi:large subunit ribosomal protein L9|nr:50S ribosomal protein L9 [Dehalococcoidales bacterium]NLT27778.1 50S ribosomal protein L9 [Dehalococcoidales bacterium]